ACPVAFGLLRLVVHPVRLVADFRDGNPRWRAVRGDGETALKTQPPPTPLHLPAARKAGAGGAAPDPAAPRLWVARFLPVRGGDRAAPPRPSPRASPPGRARVAGRPPLPAARRRPPRAAPQIPQPAETACVIHWEYLIRRVTCPLPCPPS